MNNMVDIEVVLDEASIEPRVKILTREKTKQVEDIIYAIENVSESEYPPVPALGTDGLEFLSQRDIIRAYTENRRIVILTEKGAYVYRKNLSMLEEVLNPTRFIRISQSEIINIYKVKCFDINIAGTIGVEFENGTKSWASRSCVKALKKLIKQ